MPWSLIIDHLVLISLTSLLEKQSALFSFSVTVFDYYKVLLDSNGYFKAKYRYCTNSLTEPTTFITILRQLSVVDL